jgi:hypothetical protein
MMRRFDTYGFKTMNIDQAAAFVEEALSLTLSIRETSFIGAYYWFETELEQEVRIVSNYGPQAPDWGYEAFRNCAVIMNVANFDDMDDVRQKLTEGRDDPFLLESKILPPRDDTAETDEES